MNQPLNFKGQERTNAVAHILIINYCRFDLINLPAQFTIFFDFLCDNSMPDGHAGTGYSKAAA